jgi:hypothetical protein
VKAPPEWEGEIEHFVFGGMPLLNESVFLHKPSRTLILTDLMFNFSRDLTAGQRLFAALKGASGRPSVSRLMRYFMMKDRAAVRRSAGKVLEWDFDRVLLAHKDMIDRGGKEIMRRAFEDI